MHPDKNEKTVKMIFQRSESDIKSKMSGFTLIEMAMVMIIAGIILSTIMTVLPSILKTAKAKETRALLEKYDYALLGYAIANSRLPFADSDNDGVENNNVYFGTLPYKTLGLSSGDDAWGHKIKYAVYGKSGGGNTNLTYHFIATDIGTPPVHKTARQNFQTALGNAGGTSDTAIVHTIGVGGNCSDITPDQAFVIASGGPKDLDGVNGFFDLCNGQADASNPVFNSDNEIQAGNYDDLVRSKAATVLSAEIN